MLIELSLVSMHTWRHKFDKATMNSPNLWLLISVLSQGELFSQGRLLGFSLGFVLDVNSRCRNCVRVRSGVRDDFTHCLGNGDSLTDLCVFFAATRWLSSSATLWFSSVATLCVSTRSIATCFSSVATYFFSAPVDDSCKEAHCSDLRLALIPSYAQSAMYQAVYKTWKQNRTK